MEARTELCQGVCWHLLMASRASLEAIVSASTLLADETLASTRVACSSKCLLSPQLSSIRSGSATSKVDAEGVHVPTATGCHPGAPLLRLFVEEGARTWRQPRASR